MAKERKVRSFDFLKQPLAELPTREEVIQKTVEITGLSVENTPPSVSATVVEKEAVPTPTNIISEAAPKKTAAPKAPKAQKTTLIVEEIPKEKAKVGRKALEDARKPFTSTITVENKKKLRQLCAEYDISMSDALNEMLAAQFEKRSSIYKV